MFASSLVSTYVPCLARTPSASRAPVNVRLGVRCDATPASSSSSAPRRISLQANELTRKAFEPFGQVIGPIDDNVPFSKEDAQLVLDKGTPRFYIMRLPSKPLTFDRITYHAKTTQCLGCLGDKPWYMAVARPTLSLDKPPRPDDISVFRIPPGCYVNMKVGCWHAGPMFEADHMDFYNLELSDTNITDHNTWVYRSEGLVFDVKKPGTV